MRYAQLAQHRRVFQHGHGHRIAGNAHEGRRNSVNHMLRNSRRHKPGKYGDRRDAEQNNQQGQRRDRRRFIRSGNQADTGKDNPAGQGHAYGPE